jgi:16S rRNA (cytidine1402-2'-O)-methyltransferase
MQVTTKNLYIVSTPIGNLEDITLRALEVLKKSDIILCEDTRQSIKLLNHYKIKKKLISYHKFNEKKQISSIIKYFNDGKILSLISDAGTPSIRPRQTISKRVLDKQNKSNTNTWRIINNSSNECIWI